MREVGLTGNPENRWERLWQLFDAARDLPAGRPREAFVRERCGEDAALARELGELLAAGSREDSLLDRRDRGWLGPLANVATESDATAASGSTVGGWTLGRLLGEGGMGSVFLGERRGEGFTQRAAIKLLSSAAPTALLLQRFLVERGILARLEHPGIARMLDGGVGANGAPYLAMELVEGRPLTVASRENRATVEERLALFLEVCSAVEYAHRNLVVHRDLKPSNVMVDGAGRVKLLDFGIAKLLAPGSEVQEQPTLLRALTPQYAAPEQVTGDPITTATDVYALGVLLFELLAGRLPYALADQSPFTVEQAIVGAEPVRLPQAAAVDASRPEGTRLPRRLEGDLERIVQRAMAKEPERRYRSVAALADDLRRHLAGLPVEARGDSALYRVRKFARRHRIAVVLSALAITALIAALALALAQARRAEREAARAATEAELARTSRDFLASLFASADPNRAQGRVMTDREMLAAGVERIDRELTGRTELQLPLLAEIASVYLQLGEYEKAEPLARRVLAARISGEGDGSLGAARARRLLAEIRYQRNAFEEAAELDRVAGPRLGESRELDDRKQAIEARVGLAKSVFALGRYAEAAAWLERAAVDARESFGAESPTLLNVLTTRTSQLLNSGQTAEAAKSASETAALARRVEGLDAPATLTATLNEIVALSTLGRRDEARQALSGLPERLTRVLGAAHGETLLAIRLQARLAAYDGDFPEALAALERVVAALRAADQPQTMGYTLVQASNIALVAGEIARAEAFAREAMGIFVGMFGAEHGDAAFARSALGAALARRGALAEAQRELDAAAATEVATDLGTSDFHADTLERLGDLLLRQGRRRAAREKLEEALTIRRTNSPAGNLATGRTLTLLAAALDDSERGPRCEPLLAEAVTHLRAALGPAHPDRQTAERALAACSSKRP